MNQSQEYIQTFHLFSNKMNGNKTYLLLMHAFLKGHKES